MVVEIHLTFSLYQKRTIPFEFPDSFPKYKNHKYLICNAIPNGIVIGAKIQTKDHVKKLPGRCPEEFQSE
jgi:hypothetical protein